MREDGVGRCELELKGLVVLHHYPGQLRAFPVNDLLDALHDTEAGESAEVAAHAGFGVCCVGPVVLGFLRRDRGTIGPDSLGVDLHRVDRHVGIRLVAGGEPGHNVVLVIMHEQGHEQVGDDEPAEAAFRGRIHAAEAASHIVQCLIGGHVAAGGCRCWGRGDNDRLLDDLRLDDRLLDHLGHDLLDLLFDRLLDDFLHHLGGGRRTCAGDDAEDHDQGQGNRDGLAVNSAEHGNTSFIDSD